MLEHYPKHELLVIKKCDTRALRQASICRFFTIFSTSVWYTHILRNANLCVAARLTLTKHLTHTTLHRTNTTIYFLQFGPGNAKYLPYTTEYHVSLGKYPSKQHTELLLLQSFVLLVATMTALLPASILR